MAALTPLQITVNNEMASLNNLWRALPLDEFIQDLDPPGNLNTVSTESGFTLPGAFSPHITFNMHQVGNEWKVNLHYPTFSAYRRMPDSGFYQGIAEGEYVINRFVIQGDEARGYTVAVPLGESYLVPPLASRPLKTRMLRKWQIGNKTTPLISGTYTIVYKVTAESAANSKTSETEHLRDFCYAWHHLDTLQDYVNQFNQSTHYTQQDEAWKFFYNGATADPQSIVACFVPADADNYNNEAFWKTSIAMFIVALNGLSYKRDNNYQETVNGQLRNVRKEHSGTSWGMIWEMGNNPTLKISAINPYPVDLRKKTEDLIDYRITNLYNRTFLPAGGPAPRVGPKKFTYEQVREFLAKPQGHVFTDEELAEASFGRIPDDPNNFYDLI